MHFDVLCPRVEHRVPSQIDTAQVVAVKRSWILDGYAQILENPFEPYGFTCVTAAPLYSASVLDRAMVGCFLLLQDMAPLPRENTNLEVNLVSALYPA